MFASSPVLHAALPLVLMQVGPNPVGEDGLRLPEELRNRPERRADAANPAALDSPHARWLAGCLTQMETDASRAHAQAQIKLAEALGEARIAANHCRGLAATRLGLWDDARTAFLDARQGTPQDDLRTRARFGAMAGNAALASGDAAAALDLLESAARDAEAAASTPLQVIAALDQARALVALGRGEEALAPLETATTLAPQEGDIGLEAGVIAVLSGREDAARASWQSVIDIQPDSPAAQTARGYLDQIGAQVSAASESEPAPQANTEEQPGKELEP